MTKYITNKGVIKLPRPVWAVIIYNMRRTDYSMKEISECLKLQHSFVIEINKDIERILLEHSK